MPPIRRSHVFAVSVYEGKVTGRRSQAQQDMHFRVMRLMQDNTEMSQCDLAKELGISTGGIRYVLNALLEKCLIKLGNFTAAADKRRYAYILTPQGPAAKAALMRQFQTRKMAGYEALKAEIEAVASGLSGQDRHAIEAAAKQP